MISQPFNKNESFYHEVQFSGTSLAPSVIAIDAMIIDENKFNIFTLIEVVIAFLRLLICILMAVQITLQIKLFFRSRV